MEGNAAYQQEIEQYTLDELVDIAEYIDRKKSPERFQMVVAEIMRRRGTFPTHANEPLQDDNNLSEEPLSIDDDNDLWGFHRRIMPRDLYPIWRIIVATMIAQAIGGSMISLLHLHHMTFLNMWFGAVVSAPVGFGVGLWWHLGARDPHSPLPTTLLGFLGVLVVGIALFGWLEFPRMRREMLLLQEAQQVTPAHIQQISLRGNRGTTMRAHITDREAIQGFVDATRDAQGYSPNHDQSTIGWLVTFEGQITYAYLCYVTPKHPAWAICRFIQSHDGNIENGYSVYGTFSSVRLRRWFKQYVAEIP
ncbi:MAG: hypothetical protein GY801_27970 [bacterium]|nr:hypothetical protein [bacterium]